MANDPGYPSKEKGHDSGKHRRVDPPGPGKTPPPAPKPAPKPAPAKPAPPPPKRK